MGGLFHGRSIPSTMKTKIGSDIMLARKSGTQSVARGGDSL